MSKRGLVRAIDSGHAVRYLVLHGRWRAALSLWRLSKRNRKGMTALVLTYPGRLTAQQRAIIGEQLADWDGSKPLVVQGAHVSTIGGLTFTLHLDKGPLDNLAVTITLPNFEMQGGRYVRKVSDGAQWRTVAGNPVYTWEPA